MRDNGHVPRPSRQAPDIAALERAVMKAAYYSAVLDRPAEDVWALVRDYSRCIEGVDQRTIEDERPGDSVGAVRSVRYGSKWIRQRLVALSDADRTFTYASIEPFRFPSQDGVTSPLMPIEYRGTLRVTRVVDGDRALVEWWLNFDCNPDERDRWTSFLIGAISQWVASLERTVTKAR